MTGSLAVTVSVPCCCTIGTGRPDRIESGREEEKSRINGATGG